MSTSPEHYSHQAIGRIAGPMILSALTTPLLGMVDMAVVGQLEEAYYLGAVAVGATVFSTLFMSLNFLRMGTTGLTAQAYGAQSASDLRATLGQGCITALILALGLLLLQTPLLDLALRLIKPSQDVAREAGLYYAIRIWSAPAWLLNFVLIGWLLGLQKARATLMVVLAANGTNIVLDFWFVMGLGWRVQGVALASVIAEVVGLAVALFFVSGLLKDHRGTWRGIGLLDGRSYLRLFKINRDLFLRTITLMLVFAFITAQGARLGDAVLAANAILINFQYLMSYALDGVAHAAEALVGRAAGANDRAGLLLAVRRTLKWSLGFALCFTLGYAVLGQHLIALLTSITDLRELAAVYLPWLIISPLISVWSFLYDGVYVGITQTRAMMLIMVGSALGLFLPAWYFSNSLGNHALWLAFTLFMAGRGIGMHVWFRQLLAHGRMPSIAQESH